MPHKWPFIHLQSQATKDKHGPFYMKCALMSQKMAKESQNLRGKLWRRGDFYMLHALS